MTALSETTPLSIHRLLGTSVMNRMEAKLPSRISEAVHDGSRTVMMLGPAEWLVLDQEPKGPRDRSRTAVRRVRRKRRVEAVSAARRGCGEKSLRSSARSMPARTRDLNPPPATTHLARHPAIVMPRSAGEIAILVPRSYAASLVALVRDEITRSVSSMSSG